MIHPVVAKLRAARIHLGMSQKVVAAKLDTVQSHVSEIERGTHNTQLRTLARYGGLVGKDIHLMDEEEYW